MIEGLAKGYEGRKIVAFQIEDYISEKRSVIASSDIAENGLFSLEFKPTTTGAIILSISRTEATIYASPGAHYSIIFPIVSAGTVKKFDKTSVEVSFEGLDTHDTNAGGKLKLKDFPTLIWERPYVLFKIEYNGDCLFNSPIAFEELQKDKNEATATSLEQPDGTTQALVTSLDDQNELCCIHPNPTTGKILLSCQNNPTIVRLLNSMGENVEINALGNTMDLTELADGIYIIEFSVQGKSNKMRIVKCE
ncbi:MAG: T9SS type A sorting domain-containing protein [Flavobacteriales bacterium]|nr:T9SS type A sorting domain-containing protein [Flavobacteriales bacterium]